jgi:hypothetical protein
MKIIAKMWHSLLDTNGEKWVLAEHLPELKDPAIQSGVINLNDLPALLERHGLEGVYNAFYEEIYRDWHVWFDSRSKVPEGPSRLSNREALQVLDKALVIYERYYAVYSGKDCPITMDYLYTHFMQIMGLERNVEWEDLSQWELNLLTTIEMSFAGLLLSYLSGPMEIEPDNLVPMVITKLQQLFSGLSVAMSYAVETIADNFNEFTEEY